MQLAALYNRDVESVVTPGLFPAAATLSSAASPVSIPFRVHPNTPTLLPTMSLARLVAILGQHPTIACSLSVESFLLFFRLTQHLREKLSWSRAPDLTGPPPELPHDVMDLLSRALSIDHARYPGLLANCWAVTHDFVWSDSVDQDICEGGWRYPDLLSVFLNHGVHAGFGTLLPCWLT